MENKRFFVSGGAGVIGLELIPRLINRGAHVFVGDLKPRPMTFSPLVRYRQGDLNTITSDELRTFRPNIFIHLAAAFERSLESYGFWEENYCHNVRLSNYLMGLLKDSPELERVVFASSYLIYDPSLYLFDEPRSVPVSLKETDPIFPRNLIGTAKLYHEVELSFLKQFRADQFSIISARIFRGYGRNSRDVISRWVRQLLAGETISIYRPEGMFDYIYAGDSAEGLIRLAEAHGITGVINLGTGKARSVGEVIKILQRHFPNMNAVEEESDIAFESSQADMSRYRDLTGWSPVYDLERAIPEIVEYEKKRMEKNCEQSALIGNVLVSSASRKVPLLSAVKKAASKISPEMKIIAGDSNKNALAHFAADEFWLMPFTEDQRIDLLINGCKALGIKTIFPTRDGELAFWAEHQKLFHNQGVEVIVSPLGSIRLCLDKLAFAQFGINHDLPFITASLELETLGAGPYAVKERYGAGSRKIALNLDKDVAINHSRELEHPIFQPFISGREISIDAWMDRDFNVKGVVLRRRDIVVNGESQVTTTFRDEKIEALATAILKCLKLRGPAVMQVLIDNDNNLHVIECNPRFGGASTTSIAAGLDIFYWSLLESSGVDISEYPFFRMNKEIRQIRLPSDIQIYGDHF